MTMRRAGPDDATAERAARRSGAVATAFRDGPAMERLRVRFEMVAADDVAGMVEAAASLLSDIGWVERMLAPLIAALAEEPLLEPPLRVSRDAARIGAVLFDDPRVTIAASVLSADALAAAPPPTSVVVPGRISVTRYAVSGGARLRLWRTDPVTADFCSRTAAPLAPARTVSLADGAVIRVDGRTHASLIEGATCDVVSISAAIRTGAAPFMREYALEGGRLIGCAMLDDAPARTQMLLRYLRAAGRSDAAACFERASRDPAFFVRWAAMREWLALDAPAALTRLRAMAVTDPHPDVRAAARATRAAIDAGLVTGSAVPCPV